MFTFASGHYNSTDSDCSEYIPSKYIDMFANCEDILKRCTGTSTEEEYPNDTEENEDEDKESKENKEDEQIVEIDNVTVKFHINPHQVIAQVYPHIMSIENIKKDMARRFEVDWKILNLKQCDKDISDTCVLMETDQDEFGIHNFKLELILPDEHSAEAKANELKPKLDINVYYNKHRLPDFITVHIPGEDTEDGIPKNVVVEIQDKTIVKPYICGYRNKLTGVEYWDAFTQTGPHFDKWVRRRHRTRDTQTFEYKEKLVDTVKEVSVQCILDDKNVRFVAEAPDFTIVPRKYQTYAQKMRLEKKLEKVKLIQRNWRRYLVMRYMKRAAREYRQLIINEEEEEREKIRQREEAFKREEMAKQFPHKRQDFELVYGEVEKWKKAELKRIASMYEGASRIAEVNLLLDKEIQILNGIERQRRLVCKAMEDFREEQMLKKLGTPMKWIGYKDNIVHMDLLRHQRVRFLTEVYKDMRKKLPKQERLELIRKIKEILVNECQFPEFAELFDLFDREQNLLLYTRYCDVSVLRKRQNMLFIQLIKFCQDKKLEKTQYNMLCMVCKKVKSYDAFAIQSRQNKVETCKACFNLQTTIKDNTVFSAILRSIQRDERKKRCSSSIAFVMQEDDIRYILENIWHSHSVLSKKNDIHELRLPRWMANEDWTPWNCICLTEFETHAHFHCGDVTQLYDEQTLLQIKSCHMLARSSFHQLAVVSTEFVESGEWYNVGLNPQRQVDIKPLIKVDAFRPSVQLNPAKMCRPKDITQQD